MGKTIMCVDDSVSMRQVIATVLRAAGHEVIEAGDGTDALSKLDGKKVNLLITDINMPRLDGIGLIRAVREQPANRFLPIVVVSTESQDDKKKQAQAAGAKAWIVKPFQPEQLLSVVQRVLG